MGKCKLRYPTAHALLVSSRGVAETDSHAHCAADYCDYCDVFLTHDSSSVRKAHNSGRNHLTNVKDYYSSLGHDKAQDMIDQITKMYESGGQPTNRPFPQQPSFMSGGNGGPPMMNGGGGMMNGMNGGGMMSNGPPPMRFGGGGMMNGFNPQQQQQQPQQQQQFPPQFNNSGPQGFNQPPQGFRPPPGMGGMPMPPPGFSMPPGMGGGGPPPGAQMGGPAPVATGGPELPRLVHGMNPERARALGLV